MDQELIPLSEAKTRLHELVRRLEERDLLLVRYGRPVGALVGFRRYRELLRAEERSRGEPGQLPAPRPAAEVLAGARSADLRRICAARNVRRLTLFGSAARGTFEPGFSDLDLLVEFEPMGAAERADAFFDLQEELERLFGLSVDLVEVDALRNPYLREAIERDHAVLYGAA